jgi:hypothetical protein
MSLNPVYGHCHLVLAYFILFPKAKGKMKLNPVIYILVIFFFRKQKHGKVKKVK